MFSAFYWDPNPVCCRIPFLGIPILWYGVLFATGFAIGFPVFVSILTRYLGKNQRKKAVEITDRFVVYIIVATVVGARLGHFIFYETPSSWMDDPLEVLQVWRGGLASHGAALGIVLAVLLFSFPLKRVVKGLDWVRLLDFVSVPTALAGACIRLGNFINQEIPGKPTDVPWAVIFGHPVDRGLSVPRHPVQLYEAFFYLMVFLLLWGLTYNHKVLLARGRLIGLFLVLVFGFRVVVEYWKLELSHLMGDSALTMGQILSLPAIAAGVYFLWISRKHRA